ARTWFTGLIYLLAFAGYLFYGILWTIRFMQTAKKLVIVSLVIILLGAAGAYYALFPVGATGGPVDIRVNRGASLRSIALTLEKRKVITWAPALIAWMKCRGMEKRFQAGRFVFYVNEGAVSAAQKLLHAEPVEVAVTIPEGLTIEQTALLFHNALNIDTLEFDSLCAQADFIRKLEVDEPSLEGYLFPDTYRFSEDVTAADIVRKMIAHFDESFKTLAQPPEGQSQLSKKQVVILASIIEKEAVVESERPRISAVFHNRLKEGMPLGADPTVRYIFKKYSGPLLVSELKSRSPYNTRVFAGLPPGPICSPGLASLQAALMPAESRELYFVAKWDGSGAHDFSLTYMEHNKKKETIQRLNRQRVRKEKNAKN
ncbi:MAG: endolytic transglycosylase MltG, partial [Chitinivibrionales bacterium]